MEVKTQISQVANPSTATPKKGGRKSIDSEYPPSDSNFSSPKPFFDNVLNHNSKDPKNPSLSSERRKKQQHEPVKSQFFENPQLDQILSKESGSLESSEDWDLGQP